MSFSWAGVPAVGLAACVLLAGCATTESPGAAPSPASAAATRDWANTTYSMTCDWIAPTGFRAHLVNGGARVPTAPGQTPYHGYFDIRLQTVVHGDVDGDGVPDSVVLLQCAPQPSNGSVQEVHVFAGGRGRLGVLPSASTLPEGAILAPVYEPAGLAVEHGDIVAAMDAYGPGDSHASGPSQHITVRWHWDGRSFVRVA